MVRFYQLLIIQKNLNKKGSVDVCVIAKKFGGGHKMAAGVHLSSPLNNAKQLIFEQVKYRVLSRCVGDI
jgi:nanoRNase/pAp phosphatase (c-di-AMP/oligoRNAs hydrolase)